MGDHDKGKRVEEPGVETKFKSYLVMVDWIECWISPKGTSAKSHVLPRVMRVQRVRVAEELRVPKAGVESQGRFVHNQPDWAWASLWPGESRLSANQELRMVVVKPRSREDSFSERLASVWLDNIREELVIVYETVNKLSHADAGWLMPAAPACRAGIAGRWLAYAAAFCLAPRHAGRWPGAGGIRPAAARWTLAGYGRTPWRRAVIRHTGRPAYGTAWRRTPRWPPGAAYPAAGRPGVGPRPAPACLIVSCSIPS
ncbi:hypothetical protein Bca52824_035412 [Brassica carinata]|uniref:Uncharacterized protein n=1 Tax=Brassica carinata TaxID=52824 RepID=A0A8X7S2M9_BRACI|nr:hypothetical protein Bca52824_035412 [Brassica carinata]